VDSQRERVRREFTRQAAGFEAPGSLFRDAGILDWIAAHVPVAPGSLVLDVAGGTGQTGRRLARDGGTAVILDMTDPMLAAGMASVREEGAGGVVFVRGDASALPFPDGEFDVVVSRFALHHVQDPRAVVAEMARVCRAEGSVALVDMISGGPGHDELERLRDPSHARALTAAELRDLLAAAGRAACDEAEREQPMPAEPWLEQSHTGAAERREILAALSAEADGGAPSGLHASRPDGVLTVTQTWLLLVG
jgi:ubiquinone/menaquinone biosynthesis C-methylase UbiE